MAPNPRQSLVFRARPWVADEMRNGFAAACLVLGFGVGGFIDGIVLHQLLEWHHVLSGWYSGDMKVNMLADGLFHLFCLIVVLAGIGLLVRAGPAMPARRGSRAVGWLLAGWGWFNLVEGIIDHQVLGVHHVHSGPDHLVYDVVFLAFGAALVAVGTLIGRRRVADEVSASTP